MRIERLASVLVALASLGLALFVLLQGTPAEAFRKPSVDMVCIGKDGDLQGPLTAGTDYTITYTIVVQKTGTSIAPAAVVTDVLPAGASFVSAVSTQGSCSYDGGTNTVTCDLDDVTDTTTDTITIVIDITPGLDDLVNTAGVTFTGDTNGASNCQDTITTQPPPPEGALVCLAKDVDPGTVTEGVNTDVTYDVTIQYTGDAGTPGATNVEITDTFLNAGTNGVEFRSANYPCDAVLGEVLTTGQTLTCTIGNMPLNSSATLSAILRILNPADTDVIHNQAKATGLADSTVLDTGVVSRCEEFVTVQATGDEGCTPGYWKNHLASWPPTGYTQTDLFNTVFGVSYFAGTLLQAINVSSDKILQHGTAGLLSASHPGVDYPYTPDFVIQAVQEAVAGDDTKLKQVIAANNLGCPLN